MVEEGLFVLDAHLRAGSGGLIDLLAVDASGALVVLEIERSGEDELLRRALEHQQWVISQVAFLRRLYGAERIQPFRRARAILLSPRFSGHFLAKLAELSESLTPLVYRISPDGESCSLEREPASDVSGPADVVSEAPLLSDEAPASSSERLTPEELEAFYRFEWQRLRQEKEGAAR